MDTVRSLADEILLAHWSFIGRKFPPGGFLLLLQRKCDELLVKYARSVEPLVGEAREVAAVVAGILVGLTDAGTPYYLTTSDDGWPVSVSDTGTPYFDFTQAKIATDPLGSSSAAPGFPLPDDFLKHIAIAVIYKDTRTGPVNVVTERQRHEGPQGRDPIAYINGNRLVPVRAPVLAGSSDEWTNVTIVRLSYIKRVLFSAMTSEIRLHPVLTGALVAAVANELARSAKLEHVSAREKDAFNAARVEAEKALELVGDHLVGDLRNDAVLYTSDD